MQSPFFDHKCQREEYYKEYEKAADAGGEEKAKKYEETYRQQLLDEGHPPDRVERILKRFEEKSSQKAVEFYDSEVLPPKQSSPPPSPK